MNNVYCSSCGTKHLVGARFCSNCGSPLRALDRASQSRVINAPVTRDEDGEPTVIVRPDKLEYELEGDNRNRFSVDEVISRAPATRSNSTVSRGKPSRKSDKKSKLAPDDKIKAYLEESLRVCKTSRNNFEEINES